MQIEIERALRQIDKDPYAAAQFAGNVLEASLKAYLDQKGKAYKNGNTLADLWKRASDEIGLRPADLDNKDLKMIASGLTHVGHGIAHLRNTRSAAHGKSEGQMHRIIIKPRHARLAVHAAHTVSAYILELLE